MNYIYFSPHFPPNYYPFAMRLRQVGVTILGLGDTPFEQLRPELRNSLHEYYRVTDMHRYDELVRALGYFTHRYGKIDRLESHNEYWLETDARLRTDFNIPGYHTKDISKIKRKSEMKQVFLRSGLGAARGRVLRSLPEAIQFAAEVGYPIIAKPDIGVGAYKTYKINSRSQLEDFFINKPLIEYIFEEFIEGTILTFDGLADQNGHIAFYSSMVFSDGIMDVVNQQLDIWYYIQRDVPTDLLEAGERLVKAFGVRERFFHFEFFRTPDERLVGLEVNIRPPGGLTTDMWNYANDIDIYQEYANIITQNRFVASVTRPYYCAYLGRRSTSQYTHTVQEAIAAFPGVIVHQEPISGIFAAAIGDYGIITRAPELETIYAAAEFILGRA